MKRTPEVFPSREAAVAHAIEVANRILVEHTPAEREAWASKQTDAFIKSGAILVQA